MTSPVPGVEIGAPTLLCGFPKSGTTLLTALLDGHPALLSFPTETWALKRATRTNDVDPLERVLRSNAVRALGQGLVTVSGEVRDFRGFEFERFASSARVRWAALSGGGGGGGVRAMLECLMGALAETLGVTGTTRWVEKSPEQEHELERHTETWTDLKVVHVVRDPRAVLCSFRRKRLRAEQRVFVSGLAARWRDGLAAVIRREERFPGSVTIVRYEDLVTDHRATLGRVLDALGLRWDDSLDTPSLLGRPWRGNSMYQGEMKGISAESVGRWAAEIDSGERVLLESCLAVELRALGYESAAEQPNFVREALPVVFRQRRGVVARGRALRRLLRLRRDPPAPVSSSAFARAFGRGS